MHPFSEEEKEGRAMLKAKANKPTQLDPLFVIFEQHLTNFHDSDMDRKTFIQNVLQEYLTFLRKKNLSIPKYMEAAIMEELTLQVKTMLVKKIYGCLSIHDYQQQIPRSVKK
jgi:hypothetical protein